MKPLLTAFCFLLLLSGAFAVIPHGTMKVFAVAEDGQTAMTADLILTIENGSGKVWSSVEPLIGTSTQTTEKIAVQVAKNYFGKVDSYDYKFDINSSASLVDGPSAGAAMALLVVSMLTDRKLPDYVGMTGTITTDSGVGPVGGVFKKAQEAARIGIKLFLVPVGEAKQIIKNPTGIESVNLVEYAEKNWSMKVVEVSNIDQILKLAFSDLESIDVNIAKAELPDFIPAPIGLSQSLYKMRDLTKNYVEKSEGSLSSARKTLSGTLLNDPAVVDSLLSALTYAEKDLQNAKILFDQNYLYSAANYAFLAMVNASLVKDLSENPSLADSSSTVLELKLLELKKEIERLKTGLGSFVPLEDWEWHVAAQQRLSWAEQKLSSLTGSNMIVVQIGGSSGSAFDDLQDYEFAVAWLNVAKDFAVLAQDSQTKTKMKPLFGEEIDSYIIRAENNLVSLQQEDLEDITRRIETAKNSKKKGWSAAALFDAASAFALSNAEIFVKNKDLNGLETVLNEKVSGLQKKFSESPKKFAWARMYLDHATYYLQGISFYKSNGLTSQALEMAKSGISIVFLSEAVLNASETANQYYSSVPPGETLVNDGVKPIGESDYFWLLVLAVVALAFVSALFIFLYFYSRRESEKSGMENIQKSMAGLDRLFAEKKIPYAKYLEMHSILQSRLDEIMRDKSALSKTTVKIDRMRFELQALQRTLFELERQERQGIITKTDFNRVSAKIGKKIVFLENAVSESAKDIAVEKKKISSELKEYSREADGLLKKKKPKLK